MLDKNGCEICAGDIVCIKREYFNQGLIKSEEPRDLVGVMKWINTGAGMTMAFTRNGGTYPWNPDESKVIGNIYENPELLI